MFERIRRSISHPKYAFLYIKDKLSRVILYILILTTIMTIPTILVGILSLIQIVPDRDVVANSIQLLLDDDVRIEDNVLIRNENYNRRITVDMFNIAVGNMHYNDSGYFLVFENDKIVTYLSAGNGINIISNEITYESLNINDLNFDYSSKIKLANLITTTLARDNMIVTSIVFSVFIINFFDLLMLILFLTIIAQLIRNLPLKFSDHFKINTYVATIYAITSLILILFGLTYLSVIPIIITYIYQMRAYRSIKIIKKIEVRKKDE